MAYNILLIDDSTTTRNVIAKTLKLAEIPINTLYEASNGLEGLEILKNNWIDLVFTDINMPEMNGIEMVEKMQEDGLLATLPVVIISTEGSAKRIEYLMSKGISGYIRKPFTPEKICDLVNQIMKGNEDESGL